jgi:hypothetical protein
VLESEVEDRPDNQTRFLVVARPDAPLPARAAEGSSAMKTSLLAETPNLPGALLRLLSPFAERGVNLSRLESRPAGEPWSYRFFIELEGAADAAPVRDALAAARESATVRVLGSYPLERLNRSWSTADPHDEGAPRCGTPLRSYLPVRRSRPADGDRSMATSRGADSMPRCSAPGIPGSKRSQASRPTHA